MCVSSQTDLSNVDRLRTDLVLAELAATQDEFLAVLLLAPGDAALRRHARLAHGMTTTIAATFTTTQRMVDRVHRLGARVGSDAHVARAAGLADADVDV